MSRFTDLFQTPPAKSAEEVKVSEPIKDEKVVVKAPAPTSTIKAPKKTFKMD